MKKISKILTSALAVVLTFALGLGSASAAPNTITIKEADFTADFVGISNFGMTMFTTSDGKVIYCMDIDKKPLTSGQTATLVGDADAGVYYILQHGYPKMTYKNNRGMDAEITQMALWWYLSESKLSSEFKNANDKYGIVSSTKNLLAGARSATDTTVKPSMNVSASDTSMSLTSDSKYYESAYMSATLTGAKTYNVKVTGATTNTVVVDESGNIGTTMNSGEKFKVRVPANEVNGKLSISVNFSASATVTKAKIYKPSDNSYQRMVGLFDETTELTNKVTLSVEPKNICTYKNGKYYGKSGNVVDKDTYTIECMHVCEFTDNKYFGKDGKEVDKKTFNKECNKSCEIIDGKYYGKDGSSVDKKTFEKQCNKTCEVVNGKYYGSEGAEVDQATYAKECGQEVVVPNTSANVSTLAIILGTIMLLSGASLIAYRRKMLS